MKVASHLISQRSINKQDECVYACMYSMNVCTFIHAHMYARSHTLVRHITSFAMI